MNNHTKTRQDIRKARRDTIPFEKINPFEKPSIRTNPTVPEIKVAANPQVGRYIFIRPEE